MDVRRHARALAARWRTSRAHRPSGWPLLRTELGLGAELAALCGLTFAQPILGTFGNSPETFTAFGASRTDIVAFAVIVAVVPVLAVWALAATFGSFGDRARAKVQTAVIGLLGAASASYLLRQTDTSGLWRLGFCAGVACIVASLHERWEPGRLFLRYAAPLPVFVVGVFLFASPVAPLVLPSSKPSPSKTSSVSERPPVVVIVLDELPTLSLVDSKGEIDSELVPNLARLAGTSTWYRNHTSASSATGTSLPVLLTGRFPEDPAQVLAANSGEFPDNLIARMSGNYEVHGQEWATSFCSSEQCPRRGELSGVAASLLSRSASASTSPLGSLVDEGRSLWWSQVWPLADDYDSGFRLGGKAQNADQRRRTLEFLDSIEKPTGDLPVFDYLHTALPHQPWDLLPAGQSYNAPLAPFGGEFLLTWPDGDHGRELALASRSQHLLQVQWADRLLGAVFDRLQAVDRWDEALVIVTADHGVSFQPNGPLRTVTPANQVDLAWTPLFVKLPDQREPSIDDRASNALDVLPTILDVTGLEPEAGLLGRSLAEPPGPSELPRPFVAPEAAGFAVELRKGIAALDADGLAAIGSGGTAEGYPARRPGDDLAAWRHGRHSDLLGRRIEDLGVCKEPGPKATREVPDAWSAYTRGSLPADATLPLWQAGTVASQTSIDVAVAVGDTLAGWGTTIPEGSSSRFGVLVAEPLVKRGAGDPVLYEIVSQPGCRLRAIKG